MRKQGNHNEVVALRKAFDEERDPNLGSVEDPHVIATLLKTFLMENPEPLLTNDLYEAFVGTQSIEDKTQRQEKVKYFLEMVPPYNHKMLQYLLALLKGIRDRYRVNKMSASALANTLGPIILSPLSVSSDYLSKVQSVNAIVKEMIDD